MTQGDFTLVSWWMVTYVKRWCINGECKHLVIVSSQSPQTIRIASQVTHTSLMMDLVQKLDYVPCPSIKMHCMLPFKKLCVIGEDVMDAVLSYTQKHFSVLYSVYYVYCDKPWCK